MLFFVNIGMMCHFMCLCHKELHYNLLPFRKGWASVPDAKQDEKGSATARFLSI